MTLITICSAKHSPGVTTLGQALALQTGALFIEADPAGGDLAARWGVPTDPGMLTLARCVTRLDRSARPVPRGVSSPGRSTVGRTKPFGDPDARSSLRRAPRQRNGYHPFDRSHWRCGRLRPLGPRQPLRRLGGGILRDPRRAPTNGRVGRPGSNSPGFHRGHCPPCACHHDR